MSPIDLPCYNALDRFQPCRILAQPRPEHGKGFIWWTHPGNGGWQASSFCFPEFFGHENCQSTEAHKAQDRLMLMTVLSVYER